MYMEATQHRTGSMMILNDRDEETMIWHWQMDRKSYRLGISSQSDGSHSILDMNQSLWSEEQLYHWDFFQWSHQSIIWSHMNDNRLIPFARSCFHNWRSLVLRKDWNWM
jgi:hypothetical protein